MEEENKELKKQIADLKSELEASIQREEMLAKPTSEKRTLKDRIKATKFGKNASNPNTKTGKIVRLPQTIRHIIRRPDLLKDIIGKKIIIEPKLNNKITSSPIRFFLSSDSPRRVNLLVEKLDKEMLEKGIFLAQKTDSELRIITNAEPLSSIKYQSLIKELNISSPSKISFYSSFDQDKKNNVFELEIGKNDVFLTRV